MIVLPDDFCFRRLAFLFEQNDNARHHAWQASHARHDRYALTPNVMTL
jgi:hypothetical protein